MKRRNFLKILGAAALAPVTSWSIENEAAGKAGLFTPPHALELPVTPFDAPPGTWTLASMPDTQNLAASFPEVYVRLTEWIAAHQKTHNILFAPHEGDIVDANVPVQWKNARAAMDVLNRAKVPYSLTTGNHDTGSNGGHTNSRDTLLNTYFTEADYQNNEKVGYFEAGNLQNAWHEITTPTGKFLLLALELGPRNAVLKWADGVLAEKSDFKVILMTHAYLYSDSTRLDLAGRGATQHSNPKTYPFAANGDVNDGEDVWNKLVSRHGNIHFVLCGHVLNNGTGYLASPGAKEQQVHQILANYQGTVRVDDGTGWQHGLPVMEAKGKRPFGGGGFVRLMQFHPDGKTVQIKTYSPWYDRWLTAPDQQFTVMMG